MTASATYLVPYTYVRTGCQVGTAFPQDVTGRLWFGDDVLENFDTVELYS